MIINARLYVRKTSNAEWEILQNKPSDKSATSSILPLRNYPLNKSAAIDAKGRIFYDRI